MDLRKNPQLRLLRFYFRLNDKEIRESPKDVLRWFNSICESVTSKSLVVEVDGLFNESEICNKIQDILLALHMRIENLSVFLSRECFPSQQNVGPNDLLKLFSKLYVAGIVAEKVVGLI